LAFATLERFLISGGKKLAVKIKKLYISFFARLKKAPWKRWRIDPVSFEGETGVKILSHKI
jgi:hypothetical protein